MDAKEIIARRVAMELKDGDLVNLGIGIPTLVTDYIPQGITVTLHSENGFVGLGPDNGLADPDVVNAGGKPASVAPGGAMFDSLMSFAIVRGGHLTMTVLGALEVDQYGSLANWMVPGKIVPGMGGAMDLVAGAKRVIVAMEHTAKDGTPKILPQCTLPLTGKGVVDMIVTNLAVFHFTTNGLVLSELAPGVTAEQIAACTTAEFTVSSDSKTMLLE
ncbi:3-oxoacid CoA-transferase subunit B [Anaerospora hongkongensis]|uniref:3-oxoacid CoA-transferase subunit B n=1 Tax=Anaerospora hongkongensis TaxID=244830 RepID=UPI0028A17F3A|nr:3-oxoacid CoA-transferase subunit B [Anaerospora hongkongensis]